MRRALTIREDAAGAEVRGLSGRGVEIGDNRLFGVDADASSLDALKDQPAA